MTKFSGEVASFNTRTASKVRVISGKWRKRNIFFEATSGLRPSGDRVRETLFNWLSPSITGTHCLDLFAGSGALSFEALSRGAKSCLAVDNNPRTIEWLRYNCEQLGVSSLELLEADSSLLVKKHGGQPADIVFMDPPFNGYPIGYLCQHLEVYNWLGAEAMIYIETPSQITNYNTPTNWVLWRETLTGKVCSRLYTRIETVT